MEPEPGAKSPLFSFLCLFAFFFGGPFLGIGLAGWRAPGSELAGFLSFFPLPFSFIVSLILWQGFTILLLLFRLLIFGFKRERARDPSGYATLRAKAWLLIPLPFLFMTLCGLAVGLLGEGFFTTAGIYSVVGLAYGLGMFALAKKDVWPIMDEGP